MIYFVVGLGLIALLAELYYIAKPFSAILRRNRDEKRNRVLYSDELPSVSIIVVTKSSDTLLESYLPLVLEQDYPKFEVILVDEGSWDDTEDVVRRFQKTYGERLYYTKLPKESRVVSPKKLAITVGVKAAHNDVLLFTEPGTRPYSMFWIESMVRNFITGTEFVLGFNIYNDNGKFVQHLIAYDRLMKNLKELGYALEGKPYSGSGKNMAYLKSTFFNNNGFAGMLHAEDGDDSLMVNMHSTNINTRVESSRAGVTIDMDTISYKEWRYVKLREMVTHADFTPKSKAYEMLESFVRVFYIVITLIGIVSLPIARPDWWITGLGVIGGGFVLKYALQCWIINCSIKEFSQPKFWLLPIVYDLYLPIAKALIYVFVRMKKSI